MSTPFAAILSGINQAEDRQRQKKIQDQQEQDRTDLAKLQRGALENAATDRQNALALQASQRAGKRASLRRLFPELAQAGDDELDAIPPEVYQKALIDKIVGPKMQSKNFMGPDNKPLSLLEDDQGRLYNRADRSPYTGDVTPYVAPDQTPNQPIMGSPAWLDAQEKLAKIRAANPSANSDFRREQGTFTREQGLYNDFQKDTGPAAKATFILNDTLREADRAIAGDVTSQQRMLYGFIQSMDDSVVRDSERQAVNAAAPLLMQAQVAVSKWTTGDKAYTVPKAILSQMKDLMTRRLDGNRQYLSQIEQKYQGDATRFKVEPGRFRVVLPEGPATQPPVGGGRGGSPGNKSGNINLGDTAAPTKAQQLWDAAVAKHGKEKVLREFGPRP